MTCASIVRSKACKSYKVFSTTTKGPALDVVCLNAGAALYVAGVAESHKAGVDLARMTIKMGKAKDVLARLIAVSNTGPAVD